MESPWLTRHMSPDLFKRATNSTIDDAAWQGWGFTAESVAGVRINQATALNVAAVLSCVAMLAEDVAKMRPSLYRAKTNGGRQKLASKDHPAARLLNRPNEWQTPFEFLEMLMLSLLMRGNGYAVIIRNGRGNPVKLVPVNADWVALWESPTGEIFYRVTPVGLHLMAELVGQPFLIPAEDMLHIRGFSMNGLLGGSRILLAKEAIGLALAQEQQAARWMANGTKPSGVLSTDQKLNPDAAKRMAKDWKDTQTGLQNAGKILVLEQGLKFQALSLTASDMEFLASRKFQIEEIARIFRVPLHMIASLDRSTNNNIEQQAQEYANYTLTGFTERIGQKIESAFELDDEDIFVDWNFGILTRANITARFNAYRTAIMSSFMAPNEARIAEGMDPMNDDPDGVKASKLQLPANMAHAGSQSTGTLPDGGGRPEGAKEGTEGV